MLPRNDPDRIYVAFDDHRLVANAGLVLLATLVHHLGLCELVDNHVDLGDAPGRANAGDKLLPGGVGAGRWWLHRRHRRAASWGDRAGAGLRGQGTVHPPLSRGQALGTFLRSFRGATCVSWIG